MPQDYAALANTLGIELGNYRAYTHPSLLEATVKAREWGYDPADIVPIGKGLEAQVRLVMPRSERTGHLVSVDEPDGVSYRLLLPRFRLGDMELLLQGKFFNNPSAFEDAVLKAIKKGYNPGRIRQAMNPSESGHVKLYRARMEEARIVVIDKTPVIITSGFIRANLDLDPVD